MLKFILLLVSSLSLWALTLTVDTAKENFSKYSILHLRNETPFLCTAKKNPEGKLSELICAFAKIPGNTIEPIESTFFSISTTIREGIFFIIIKPNYKLFFMPVSFDLTQNDTFYKSASHISKRWLIVGYYNKLPLIDGMQRQTEGLNLPITFPNKELPYIGALDLRGQPIHVKQLKDIMQYVKIKEDYKAKEYIDALSLIESTMLQYPNSVFGSEYLYYKIKIYDKLHEDDQVIASSKVFLRQYSGDQNMAEVLSLIAKAYLNIESNSDADYFYDRLFHEHADSKYAKIGMIDLADKLLSAGKKTEAFNYYLQALNTTKNLDVAAMAAYRLSIYELNASNIADAREYTQNILDAHPVFFAENVSDAIKLANLLAKKKEYLLASSIVRVTLKSINKQDPNHELLLKDLGIWLADAGQKKEAISALDKYIAIYKEGDYIDDVTKAKDALFFGDNDKNDTQRLQHYNDLISKYNGGPIAKKALQKKAKLLFEMKHYADVLALNPKGMKALIDKSAVLLLLEMVNHKQCDQAIDLYIKYKITLGEHLENGMYDCAMKTLHYKIARDIAHPHVDSTVLTKRMKWLYRYALADYNLEKYAQTVTVGEDLTVLIGSDKASPYNDIYRTLFDSYVKLKNTTKMVAAINKIVSVFDVNYNDITRYMQMVDLGTRLKDDTMIITYGGYVYDLQEKAKVYLQSPYIEFTLAQAYIDENHINKAVTILSSLDKRELKPSQRARQQYLLGSLLQRLWRNSEAKKAFEESIKADKNSPWAKLAADAIKLL